MLIGYLLSLCVSLYHRVYFNKQLETPEHIAGQLVDRLITEKGRALHCNTVF